MNWGWHVGHRAVVGRRRLLVRSVPPHILGRDQCQRNYRHNDGQQQTDPSVSSSHVFVGHRRQARGSRYSGETARRPVTEVFCRAYGTWSLLYAHPALRGPFGARLCWAILCRPLRGLAYCVSLLFAILNNNQVYLTANRWWLTAKPGLPYPAPLLYNLGLPCAILLKSGELRFHAEAYVST